VARKIPKIVKEIQKNPPSPVNYSYQKNISYSQLSLYNGCQHRWKLQYKDKIKAFTSSIHTVFGSAIHETIQNYLDIMYAKSGAEADRIDLEEYFRDKFITEYQTQYKSNKNQHFSSPEEMREFFEDGVNILNWFKKKRGRYFSRKGWYLVGCEIPISLPPHFGYKNIIYNGFLDVVLYHEGTNEFTIIDIKTSTRGWNDLTKKDEIKQFQLLLYKQFFSEQYGIPLENIKVEFFIVKRKVPEDVDYEVMARRVQTFSPPSGKNKLKKAKNLVNSFIQECFNSDGKIKDKEYPKNISKWNCGFCPFKEDKENCGEGIIFS